MKIVYIYPALTTVGGADRIITEKANYFADKCNFDVYIITAHQNKKPLFFPLSPRIKHIDLNIDFNKQYDHSLFIRGLIYCNLIKKYKTKLSETLCSIKPDFTITTISRDIDFLTSIKDGSKKIAEAHTTKNNLRNLQAMIDKGGLYRIIGNIWRYKMENAIKKFDALVVLTKQDAKDWESIRNTIVIPNALPFHPETFNDCSSKKVISIGRFEIEKGHDRLIEVWNLVVKRHKDWILDIYGEGTLKEGIFDEIKTRNLDKNINIYKPVTNISAKYNESSIYLMASRYEGFGMVLAEAMIHGIPCVAYDCPDGPRTIIKNNEDGFIIEDGNTKLMAEKICYLIEHDEIRKEMGKKAQQNIQRYSNELINPLWIELFYSLK